ncbi:MAG: cytochrome c [Pseudomonadota bacterium]
MSKKKIPQHNPPTSPSPLQAARSRSSRNAIVAVSIFLGLATIVTLTLTLGPSSTFMTVLAKPAHGEALYRQYCVACHGAKGIGEFNWQSRERAAPPLDSSGHAWHHEDAQLISMILDKPLPDSKMPAWRTVLSRDDVLDLLAYIKSLWTPYIRENCQGARHMGCMRMR